MEITKEQIEEKIKTVKRILQFLDSFVYDKIKEIGTTESSRIVGKSKQYLTDYLHGRSKMSFKQILDIAVKLNKKTNLEEK